MTKLIKLIVAKEHNKIYPLLDNNNNRVNPRHFEDLNINLVSALSDWQQNYDESYEYHRWDSYSKLNFEREGLILAQCLSMALPKDIKVMYFSELYQQEIEV